MLVRFGLGFLVGIVALLALLVFTGILDGIPGPQARMKILGLATVIGATLACLPLRRVVSMLVTAIGLFVLEFLALGFLVEPQAERYQLPPEYACDGGAGRGRALRFPLLGPPGVIRGEIRMESTKRDERWRPLAAAELRPADDSKARFGVRITRVGQDGDLEARAVQYSQSGEGGPKEPSLTVPFGTSVSFELSWREDGHARLSLDRGRLVETRELDFVPKHVDLGCSRASARFSGLEHAQSSAIRRETIALGDSQAPLEAVHSNGWSYRMCELLEAEDQLMVFLFRGRNEDEFGVSAVSLCNCREERVVFQRGGAGATLQLEERAADGAWRTVWDLSPYLNGESGVRGLEPNEAFELARFEGAGAPEHHAYRATLVLDGGEHYVSEVVASEQALRTPDLPVSAALALPAD
jgi:hypothetical protein